MPSDIAFYFLTRPFGISLQFALLFLPVLLLRAVAPLAFWKIGLLRFVLGYAAVSLATVGLAFFEAFTLGRSKVALGHIPADSLVSWVGSSTIYLFVLIFIFTLVFTSFVVAPVTVWFASRNRATLPAVVAIGVAAAVLVAALAALFPANEWASTHHAGEFFAILSSVGVGIVLVPLAFGLGAGLPIRRRTGENAT